MIEFLLPFAGALSGTLMGFLGITIVLAVVQDRQHRDASARVDAARVAMAQALAGAVASQQAPDFSSPIHKPKSDGVN